MDDPLSAMERSIITGLRKGLTSRQIAERSELGKRDIDYLINLLETRFGARNRVSLIDTLYHRRLIHAGKTDPCIVVTSTSEGPRHVRR